MAGTDETCFHKDNVMNGPICLPVTAKLVKYQFFLRLIVRNIELHNCPNIRAKFLCKSLRESLR